ncbi:MAG: bifunctional 4-hydroxy-2-oxoglutarate aldolase/2-dehydro-3-deoxy-phosphogluconate aldolase [Acidimicrobiia bacterium]|nr:MAG: bifunctional 4-hydroxy-2-oxoglutarate aldolase/2-dehydro-3-deoxy-phosphogluconate aldolase [Acidimicrobiia bacterium]
MAKFPRLQVLTAMIDTGLVPVFYHDDAETAQSILAALTAGGARTIEFTNRGDHAFEVFSDLEKYASIEHPDVILGIGSVVDAVTAGLYLDLGANFVVGPMLNQEVARICNRRKVAYSPGCATLTEISTAEELGCEIVKIFPGDLVGGPAFVKTIHGPCPWSLLMPTGGVDITHESLATWFGAGVACVGIGSKLVSNELVQASDWSELERRTAQVVATIETVRNESQ